MSYVVKLIRIDAPADIFDVPDAYVMRRKRVPVALVDEMAELRRLNKADAKDNLYAIMAQVYPEWQGIVDVVTGEALPNPADDAAVFDRLDVIEQLPWLGQMMRANPKVGKSTPAQI